jgi:hypothetical protein
MKNKLLAIFAFVGAPFLGIDFYRNMYFVNQWDVSTFTRVCDILYLTGWICTMFALIERRAAGTKKAAKNILYIQILFLLIALSSDIVAILKIPIPANIFFFWDLFWPLSNCMMLVAGIAIAAARVLAGWKRWIAVAMGLWLPVTMIVRFTLPFEWVALIGGTYSIVLWTIMAWIAFDENKTTQLALAST